MLEDIELVEGCVPTDSFRIVSVNVPAAVPGPSTVKQPVPMLEVENSTSILCTE